MRLQPNTARQGRRSVARVSADYEPHHCSRKSVASSMNPDVPLSVEIWKTAFDIALRARVPTMSEVESVEVATQICALRGNTTPEEAAKAYPLTKPITTLDVSKELKIMDEKSLCFLWDTLAAANQQSGVVADPRDATGIREVVVRLVPSTTLNHQCLCVCQRVGSTATARPQSREQATACIAECVSMIRNHSSGHSGRTIERTSVGSASRGRRAMWHPRRGSAT